MAFATTTENLDSGNVRIVSFTEMSTGGTATSPTIELSAWGDRSVQVAGTLGGATVTISGSNDGTNFATLADAQGNALTITTAKIEQILEATRYIKAVVSGGTGDDIDVTFFLRRAQPLRV